MAILLVTGLVSALALLCFYRLYWHPLAKFPGPWYASCFSLSAAIISLMRIEPDWLASLVKKYGTDTPIRVQPGMLFFPQPSAGNEIYWDPKCNQKSSLYGTGAVGPPHLFSTLDGATHRALRKALGGPQWTIGSLKNNWESRIGDHVQLLVSKLTEAANKKESVCLSDRAAQFAADIMSMISFTDPFGFVEHSCDQRHIIQNWRRGLDIFGFVGRFQSFQKYILSLPGIAPMVMPKVTDDSGMGWLMGEAVRQVAGREAEMKKGIVPEKPDFMQHCLDARMNGEPLSALQKQAHVTLLIQGGADTTGTGLGSAVRYLVTHPEKRAKVQKEIDDADRAGLLSTPVQFEETRRHLPYSVACMKESLRLNPPGANFFARVVPKEGKTMNGQFIPPGTDITGHSYISQRDPDLYGPDPNEFRPERWLDKDKASQMDSVSLTFGMGSRVCLGKDIAIMEMYKLVPELIRRFNFELVNAGTFVVAGGAAYNLDFVVIPKRRD